MYKTHLPGWMRAADAVEVLRISRRLFPVTDHTLENTKSVAADCIADRCFCFTKSSQSLAPRAFMHHLWVLE